MAKLRRWALVALFAALVGAAAWYFTRPKPVAVVLAGVDRGLVERTVTNTRAATVTACRRAKLAPPAGGQIARLLVREGDRVKRGQVLLELWSDDLRAQLDLARDRVAAARARADQVCLSAELAQRDAERAQQLRDERFISAEALDRAISQARAQRAACMAAKAETEEARAGINVAEATLSRQRLRAPFDGIVAEVTGELGEFAHPAGGGPDRRQLPVRHRPDR
jgi:HlyD family secretion protein